MSLIVLSKLIAKSDQFTFAQKTSDKKLRWKLYIVINACNEFEVYSNTAVGLSREITRNNIKEANITEMKNK